jgi:hypothetical protein
MPFADSTEKGVTIRQPSTANLMVDSADRLATRFPSANDFQITRPNSILNGFFSRIGTTEVVLEYKGPNISADLSNNNILTVDLSGSIAGTISTSTTITTGSYTVAELLDAVANKLSDISGSWSVVAVQGGGASLEPAADVYVSLGGPVADALAISTVLLEVGPTAPLPGLFSEITEVDLRPFRYLDFISAQLTYNQDLKDSSTAPLVRDVLCRWYMAWDQPPQLDAYGFPILMGYTPFTLRRTFSPPKQIRWDKVQPIGNLAFQVYNDRNELAPWGASQWLMTLQVSEV